MKINEFCIALFPLILIFFLFLLSCGKALAGNGIEKGHFRFLPELSIYGGYNDNVYRANTNRKSSLFGVLSPAITIDYAIAPQNYFSLHYKGDFEEYTQVDNFRQDHHFGLFKWQWRRPSGTEFQAGTNATDTAVQPYSETQKARSYIQAQAFAEMDLAVGAFSYFGLRYRFVMREFDDQIYSVDNYRKNTFSTDFTYGYFKRFPLLLEYQFLTQDNNDAPDALSPDFTTHTILAGARWRGDARLSGALRFGYSSSSTDQEGFGTISSLSSFAMDTDLTYRYSPITTLRLGLIQRPDRTTRAERETGNFILYTAGTFSISYQYWEKIILDLAFIYAVKDYEDVEREDKNFSAGLWAKYLFADWVSCSLGYRFRQQRSTLEAVEFNEKIVTATLTFSI